MFEPETATDTNTARGAPGCQIGVPADSLSASSARQLATRDRLWRRAFSFPALLASLLVGAAFVACRSFNVDPDLWWHIKVGETILRTHQWPLTDVYSFTVTGQPWIAYEWLGETLLAAVDHWGGTTGVAILLVALGSMIVLALYGLATVTTGKSKAGFVAASVLFLLAEPSFSMRPQMLGYLFLILTLIALEGFRKGKSTALWFLPLLMLVWVNTHGSWIIGMGTIFAYWMSGLFQFRAGGIEATRWSDAERKQIAFVFLLSLIAIPITPYGTRLAASPFEFAFSLPLNAKYINEWQPMPFDLPGGKVFLILLLAIIFLQVMERFTWRIEQLGLYLFGTMMACLHARFLLIFVPFCTPLLATMIARWMPRYDPNKDKFALNAVLMIGIGAGIVHYFPARADLQREVARQFPVAAVQYLDQHPIPGPMYNTYGFGGYLIWSRGPEHKVFLDGRGDLYERGGVLADYMHIARLAPGALTMLDKYGIQSCLIQRDEPLSTALTVSGDWRRIYFDEVSALFVRARRDDPQQ